MFQFLFYILFCYIIHRARIRLIEMLEKGDVEEALAFLRMNVSHAETPSHQGDKDTKES